MKRFFFSVGYFLLLIYLVLLLPYRKDYKLIQTERVRLHPIYDSVRDLFNTHGETWYRHAFYFFGNFFVNIVLFVPFSFVMMGMFNMRKIWKIALLGCLLSLAIEIIQYYTGRGVADVDDVILNTAGVIAGAYLCRFFQNKPNYFIQDEY
jgi:glycopeptide antibiotics resistance protein